MLVDMGYIVWVGLQDLRGIGHRSSRTQTLENIQKIIPRWNVLAHFVLVASLGFHTFSRFHEFFWFWKLGVLKPLTLVLKPLVFPQEAAFVHAAARPTDTVPEVPLTGEVWPCGPGGDPQEERERGSVS